MLRESLKHEIDTLNDSQLASMAEFVASIKKRAQKLVKGAPFWQKATPKERARDFRQWVAGLQENGASLSDDAFDRETIYLSDLK